MYTSYVDLYLPSLQLYYRKWPEIVNSALTHSLLEFL